MSDPNDKTPEQGPVTGRQSIREVMAALRASQEEERRQEALSERKRQRVAKEKRIRVQRDRRMQQVRAVKQRRESALRDANGKVANHVATAHRELRAALRDAMSVPLPRHTQEGREQLRVRRSIESAMSVLRRVGKGTFHVPDLDLDFDDVGA